MNIFRAGFVTHQDDCFATIGGICCIVGGEIDLAYCSTWRCSKTLGEHNALVSELWVQHLVEVVGSDAHESFFLRDLPCTFALAGALGHVDSHLQCCCTSALANTCLQHPQFALLNSELGVAHIFVVLFEAQENGHEFSMNNGEFALQRIKIFGVADTSNNVFTLCIDEEVAIWLVVACCSVTREANAGAGVAIAVTKHHGLNVDRGTEIVADFFAHTVSNGAWAIP